MHEEQGNSVLKDWLGLNTKPLECVDLGIYSPPSILSLAVLT